MARTTRGPLPSEVYWRRRMVLLGLVLLLVVGTARLVTSGDDEPTARGTAAQAGAQVAPSPSAAPGAAPGAGATTPAEATPTTLRQKIRADRKAARKAARAEAEAAAARAAAALPDPVGPCSPTDVVVTPSVPSPVAGSDVVVDLDLRTRFSPACTWTVSPEHLAVKITSGPDDIWSSQQCPRAVPTQEVVVRRAVGTPVQVTWHARRSDEDCSARTDWAMPGYYHVLAAALAGEPTEVQFELTRPVPQQVVETVAAEPTGGKKKRQ